MGEMKVGASVRCLSLVLLLTCLSGPQTGGVQPEIAVIEIKEKPPAENARIIRSYVDKPTPNSGYETGNLHIVYSDLSQVVRGLSPKAKSAEGNNVYNQEGITDVKVASGKRTVGWAETFDNCCTSYSIPLVLAIYRSGRTILEIREGQMIWFWMFRDGGKQIAAVWGPTHGPEVGDYQLYDTQTGRLISEAFGNPATQSLNPDAPEWAKETERAYRSNEESRKPGCQMRRTACIRGTRLLLLSANPRQTVYGRSACSMPSPLDP